MKNPYAEIADAEQANPYAALQAEEQANPYAALQAKEQANPYAQLDQADQAPAGGFSRAWERGKARLTEMGADLMESPVNPGTWFPGVRKETEQGLDRLRVATNQQKIDNAPDANRGLARAIGETVVESLPSSLPSIVLGAAGAAVGGPAGAAVGMGLGSGAAEYSASVDDYLREQGVDYSDPVAIRSAYENPALMGPAREFARTRGAVVGGVDALTGGVSGKVASTLIRAGRPVVGAVAGVGLDALGGSAGEGLAQVATDGRVTDWGSVGMEAAASLASGPVEVAQSVLSGERPQGAQVMRMPAMTPEYLAQQRQFSNAGAAPGGVPPAAGQPTASSPAGAAPAPFDMFSDLDGMDRVDRTDLGGAAAEGMGGPVSQGAAAAGEQAPQGRTATAADTGLTPMSRPAGASVPVSADAEKQISAAISTRKGFPVRKGSAVDVLRRTRSGEADTLKAKIIGIVDENTVRVEYTGLTYAQKKLKLPTEVDVGSITEPANVAGMRRRARILGELPQEERRQVVADSRAFNDLLEQSPTLYDVQTAMRLGDLPNPREAAMKRSQLRRDALAVAKRELGLPEDADMSNPVVQARALPILREYTGQAAAAEVKAAPETSEIGFQDIGHNDLVFAKGSWYRVELDGEGTVKSLKDGETIELADVPWDVLNVRGRLSPGDTGYDQALNQYSQQTRPDAARAAEVVAEEPDVLTLPNLTQEQLDAQRAAEAEQARQRAEQAEIARRAAAPMQGRGKQESLDTPGLFDEEGQQDLFTQRPQAVPSPETGGASGSRGPDPAAPINSIPRDFQPNAPGMVRNGVNQQTGDLVGTGDIIRFIENGFDVPIREGKYRRPALGFYRTFLENIRLRKANMVPTAFHELGHYLHNVIFPGNPGQSTPGTRLQEYSTFGGAFDGELLALGARTSLPSYTRQQVRMEGVAEFLRTYMDDRAAVLARAPTFTAHFETEIAKRPELDGAVRKAAGMVQRWKNQTPLERIGAQIRSSRDVIPDVGVREFLRSQYTKWVDETAPIDRALRQMEEAGASRGAANAIRGQVTNYIGGWRGKVEDALNTSATNLRGRKVGESLREILQDAAKATPRGVLLPDQSPLELFSRYAVAKHAQVDLMPRGIETGLLAADVDAVVRQFDGAYRPILQRLIQFQRTQRDLLVEAGILTRDQANAMDTKHQWYVPFHRVVESVAGAGKGTAPGFVNTQQGVRKLKGSRREIINPLESIIQNAYVFRDLAERNRIGLAFTKFISSERGGGRIGDEVVKEIRPTKVGTEDIVRMLEESGADPALIDEVRTLGPTGNVWKAIDSIRPRDGVFRVWDKGKERHFQVDDRDLYRALAMMDSADAELMSRFPLLKTANVFTRIKRAGATLGDQFIARNFIRDQFTAGIYAKDGAYTPFADLFKGMFHVLKKDDVYNRWVRAGGRYSHMVGADKTNLEESLAEVARDPLLAKPENLREMLAVMGRKPLEVLQSISATLEESTRVQHFANRLALGDSDQAAANLSKDLTINFARAGAKGKLLNKFIAFFNAGVQDLDKIVREHRNPATARAVMTRGFLYITVPSILLWMLNKDDEEIEKLPEWRKNLAWNIRVGGTIFSIPKPFLLGHIYGTSVERALDYLFKDDPNAMREWVSAVNESLPLGGVGPASAFYLPPKALPDLAIISVEGITKYSLFRDGPLVPQRLQGLPAADQYSETTSMTARQLGSVMGVSPILIDNTIRNTFANLGKAGTDVIDWTLLKLGVGDLPARPDKPLLQSVPGLRGLVVPELAASGYLDQFYTGSANAEKLLAAVKNRDPQREAPWFRRHGADIAHYAGRVKAIRKTADRLGDLNGAMRKVMGDRTMTGEAKRARLLELNRQRDELAKRGVEMLLPKDLARER